MSTSLTTNIRVLILMATSLLITACTPKPFIYSEHHDRIKHLKKVEAKIEANLNNPRCTFRHYYEMALRQDVHAQYMLSQMYLKGVGVPYNLKKSVHWYNRAQKQTARAFAKYRIGKMFLANTKLFEKDEQEAIKWLTQSAEEGCAVAQNLLGDLYHRGALRLL